MRKAHIHHRDGNPTNNPPDGSNWMVLCPGCHNKTHGSGRRTNHQGSGVYVTVMFAPWKRNEILKMKGNCCELCGAKAYSNVYSTTRRAKRCEWCGRIIPNRRSQIQWRDGRIMCRECFEKYSEEV